MSRGQLMTAANLCRVAVDIHHYSTVYIKEMVDDKNVIVHVQKSHAIPVSEILSEI